MHLVPFIQALKVTEKAPQWKCYRTENRRPVGSSNIIAGQAYYMC